MTGEIVDTQIDSKIAKDIAGAGVGWVSFSANLTALDEIQIGAVTVGFDKPASDINVTIAGSLSATLDAAVIAINAGAIGVYARKDANNATLILTARAAGVAGNLALAILVDFAGVMVLSAALMTGGKALAVKEAFSHKYAITAADVAQMAVGTTNSEIVIMSLAKTAAPTVTILNVRTATGALKTGANLLTLWKQLSTGFFALCLEDNGPDLAATDTIEIIAIA